MSAIEVRAKPDSANRTRAAATICRRRASRCDCVTFGIKNDSSFYCYGATDFTGLRELSGAAMRYTTFGRLTGLRVSQYALGTANLGTADTSAGAMGSRQIFDAFVAAGGTTFDTSNIYQDGQAEIALGELLGADRDDFVVITKYSGTRQSDPRPGTTGNSRKTMRRALEASLRRLRTDHVDVFMPHFPDGTTPLQEILAGFDDLVRAGKILHGGLSNFPAWRVAGAAVRAALGGLGSVRCCTPHWPAACSPASTGRERKAG